MIHLSDASSPAPVPEVPGWDLERSLWRQGYRTVIGIDEAGRGCLAGPVTAAAVILPRKADLPYRDSKQLKPEVRQELAARLADEAITSGVGWASAAEIDEVGILQATHLASYRALEDLNAGYRVTALVTDYLKLEHAGPVLSVARADQRSLQVAAASILAKTTRDALMVELDSRMPAYGFARHKGYGTPEHLAALDAIGPCAEHRMRFAPVAARMHVGLPELQCTDENGTQHRGQLAAVE